MTAKPKRVVGRPFKPGQSGNPKGRPKRSVVFREACSEIVDELVTEAWEQEVRERGPHWVEASKLLALYGKGRPLADASRPLGLPAPVQTVDAEVVKPQASVLESTPSEKLERLLANLNDSPGDTSEQH